MGNRKKLRSFIIIGSILFLFGAYTALDWFRFYHKPAVLGFYEAPFTPYMKVLVSFLCCFMVWLIGKNGVDREDTKRLKLAFSFIFLADLSFLLKKETLGIVIFVFCQFLLIYRNGIGIKIFFQEKEWLRYKKKIFLYGLVAIAICIGVIMLLIHPILHGNTLFYIIFCYGAILCTSTWVAWVSRLVKKLPGINTAFIAIGMTFFLLCDLTVGVSMALKSIEISQKTEFQWMISSSLTWMFYTPALVLLMISGYNLKD